MCGEVFANKNIDRETLIFDNLRIMQWNQNILLRYSLAVIGIVVAIIVRLSLSHFVGDHIPFLFVLCAVVAASWFGGRGPGLLSAVLGGVATWYFVLPPSLTFSRITDAGTSQLTAFMIISGLVALLTGSLRKANDAIQEREARLEFMAAAMPEILFTADASGQMESLSEKFHEFTGKRIGELSPEGWCDVVHPEEKAAAVNDWKTAVSQKIAFRRTCRLADKNGIYRWFQCRAVPIHDKRRNIVRWFGVCADIDDHKVLEERLAEQKEALSRSNEDLQRFAFAASHDLQEPLRTIAIFSEMLIRKRPETVESSYLVAQIKRGVQRMQDLIQSSLDFARINTDEVASDPLASLDDCLSDALWSLQARIDEAHAQIIKHPLPHVAAQPVLISRVFQNLIDNAIKFRSERWPLIEIKATKREDVDVISVSDNGLGIPPEFAQRIFEPFQRISDNNDGSRGTGLGLASVRRIVERNGGRVWVESEPGCGSTFFFTLEPSKSLIHTRQS